MARRAVIGAMLASWAIGSETTDSCYALPEAGLAALIGAPSVRRSGAPRGAGRPERGAGAGPAAPEAPPLI
jgi:hypothetical protein